MKDRVIRYLSNLMTQEQVLLTLTVTGQGVEKIPTTLTRVLLGGVNEKMCGNNRKSDE